LASSTHPFSRVDVRLSGAPAIEIPCDLIFVDAFGGEYFLQMGRSLLQCRMFGFDYSQSAVDDPGLISRIQDGNEPLERPPATGLDLKSAFLERP